MAFETGTCLNSLQALVMQGLLEGTKTCNLESYKHCVLSKKAKAKFGTIIHHTESLLNLVHMDIWDQPRLHHLDVIINLSLLLMIDLGIVGYTLLDKDLTS